MWTCQNCQKEVKDHFYICPYCDEAKEKGEKGETKSSGSPKSEKELRYPALRTIASLLKILGIVISVIAVIVVLVIFNINMNQEVLLAVIISNIVVGGFFALLSFALGELIYLFIDIEENTRNLKRFIPS
ncbi:MAG TPA: hypothetical protein VI461_10000 [Chitinophagaceae bacterium]|nr:hypothetical protein [Chitinophagaceae bacterium]